MHVVADSIPHLSEMSCTLAHRANLSTEVTPK
jgi:hypothetical protein